MGKSSSRRQSSSSASASASKAPTLVPIARPLAAEKLEKRLLSLAGAVAKKKTLRRGVKEVVKALRKGEKGLCIIAGDISPIDVISHLPVLCEDNKVQYVFVPSKAALGEAACTKRPTSVVLVKPPVGDTDDASKYKKLVKTVRKQAEEEA